MAVAEWNTSTWYLVMRFPEKYGGPILTTNFDPLLSVAIRRAGGAARRTVLSIDGALPKMDAAAEKEHNIVHMHGYWRDGDTLHTPTQLGLSRERLHASVQSLLRNQMVVIVGYGGWDDSFARALAAVMDDDTAHIDVVWAFYEGNQDVIPTRYARLIDSVKNGRRRNRFRPYIGADCRSLFDNLFKQVGIAGSVNGPDPVSEQDQIAVNASKEDPPSHRRLPSPSR